MVIFGAKAQVIVGAICTIVGLCVWLYWTIVGNPGTTVIFHISMFFGIVACYAIISNGLGYRATERVETIVKTGDNNED